MSHAETVNRKVPRVCGIVNGKDQEAVGRQIEAAGRLPVEWIEWRLDAPAPTPRAFEASSKWLEAAARALEQVGKPVILTLRSENQGGSFRGSDRDWGRILRQTDGWGTFRLIDLELHRWEGLEGELPAPVGRLLVSHHDFEGVPEARALRKRFDLLASKGTPWVKGAFMARDFSDTLRLMTAAWEFKNRCPDRTLVYMAMGEAGRMSRILAGEAASALTYAVLDGKGPAAPGQWPIETLLGIKALLEKDAR